MAHGTTKILTGQKALVAGAGSGIGKAAAIALGQAGADVVVNYATREEDAKADVEEIRRSGVRVFTHRADVSDENQVQEMFRRAIAELGTIDILVNNAGLQRDAPFHTMSLVQWNTAIAVNLTGQFLCAREAARIFAPRRRPGGLARRRKDHLYQLGARNNSVGRARQLLRFEGRRGDDDEDPRPGGLHAAVLIGVRTAPGAMLSTRTR